MKVEQGLRIKAGPRAKAVLSLLVQHSAYAKAAHYCRSLMAARLVHGEQSLAFLVGVSRVGKSWVANELALAHPRRRQEGRLVCPVLLVSVPSSVTPKDLPTEVLKALGVPLPKKKLKMRDLFEMMLEQLELAQVKVIIFDEASHLVDVGSKIPPRQASDWFKDLLDNELQITVILTGVPRLLRLLESNEQLRNRAFRPYIFMPYRFDDESDRKQFAGCVKVNRPGNPGDWLC